MRQILTLAILLLLTQPTQADSPSISFDRYHSYDEITRALRQWGKQFKRYVRVRSLGKSIQGREIWLISVTDRETGDGERKTGIYIDGGHHGNEIASSEAAFYLADYLLRKRAHPSLSYLLKTHVFYIVPRVNPDANELALSGIQVRGNLRPRDNDRDGRADEDGPEDINGDGLVTQMRVPHARGRYVAVKNTRYMTRAGWSSSGQRYKLYTEGIDNDGDGRINEDGPGGVDLNRNYPPMGYSGKLKQPSEPEARAVLKFLTGARNIATVQSLHTYGGILFRPYGALADSDIDKADMAVFDKLAEAYTLRTGNNAYSRPYGTGRRIYGALLDHAFGRLGMYALTAELWRPPGKDTRKRTSFWGGLESIRGRSATRRWREFNEKELNGEGTLAWKPFNHPTLGKVEIGGWNPFVQRNPPPSHLAGICHKIGLFMLDQARQAPSLVIRKAAIAGNLLTVQLTNVGQMPTFSQQGLRVGRYARDMLGIRLPAGMRLADGQSGVQKFGPLAGGQSITLRFALRGKPSGDATKIRLVALSEKGGMSQTEVAGAD